MLWLARRAGGGLVNFLTSQCARTRISVFGSLFSCWFFIVNTACLAADSASFDQAEIYMQSGNYESAAKLAHQIYIESAGKTAQQCRALLLAGEAQQALGEYSNAIQDLSVGLDLAEQLHDKSLVAALLGGRANAQIAYGFQSGTKADFLRAIRLAEESGETALEATLLNNLGNYYATQGDKKAALDSYRHSAELSDRRGVLRLAAQAYANAGRILVGSTSQRSSAARVFLEKADSRLRRLPVSDQKAFLTINIARSFGRLGERGEPDAKLRAFDLLRQAEDISKAIGNQRTVSYALGYMGELYEKDQRVHEAMALTRRALFLAQLVQDEFLLYLWHWQLGRLTDALSDQEAAIGNYQRALEILQRLRYQMPVTYGAEQGGFNDAVEPVYSRLVDLLLKQAAESRDPSRIEALLRNARDAVENLKAAELRDYFKDECVDALREKIKDIEQISSSAIVVYPIILERRIEFLVSLKSGRLMRYATPITRDELVAEIRVFRRLLEKRTTNEFGAHARKLYRWLIEPFEAEMRAAAVDTIVFVPDGALRTIPMAALYDGKQFLIERYAVAVTPGVQLTDPRKLDIAGIDAVLGGLSKPTGGFPALSYVPAELEGIREMYGGKILLDETFRTTSLKQLLRNSQHNVLHIATHGQFSSRADDSFLLAYDGRITLDELAEYVGMFKFRETPLELLVLSACETAQGDDRAALGLSGVAIKAGARSALGALWKVNDIAAAQLMNDFYRELQNPAVSRAEALRRSQLNLLKDITYRHPAYWAAFLMMNNWL